MPLSDYQTALVTGASSGIGAAIARQLSQRGITVHAVARRSDRLQQLAAECGCQPHVLDVLDSAAIYATLGGLNPDIVINNAGLGRGMSGLLDCAPEDVDATIGTNVSSLYHVLKAVAPGMVQRRRGHIVNIGSVAGLYPINSAIYGGSKGAVHLLSQNLRIELRGSGVRVTEICPGRVATEFFEAALGNPEAAAKVQQTGTEHLTADDIAAAIMYALDAPWRVNVSLIELQPTEQSFGGFQFSPVAQ